MSSVIASAAELLRTHTWVAYAETAALTHRGIGAFIVVNALGIAVLRNQGRQHLIDRWKELLAQHDANLPESWHLSDVMPVMPVALILHSPPSKLPVVLSQQRLDETITFDLCVPLDLRYFSGHFPTAPVLPGVVQVAWALELASPLLHTPKRCHSMEALKFQRFLRPADHVTLEVRAHPDGGKLYFTYRQGKQHCSSGRLLWNVSP